MTRIRRERALLEAYERDGWRGAAKEKLKPVEVSRSRPGSGLGSTSRGIGVARFVADRRLFFLQTQELHRARTSIYEAQMTIRRCFRVFDECGGCKPLPLAAFEGGDPEHGAIDQADIFCGKVRQPASAPRRVPSAAGRASGRG